MHRQYYLASLNYRGDGENNERNGSPRGSTSMAGSIQQHEGSQSPSSAAGGASSSLASSSWISPHNQKTSRRVKNPSPFSASGSPLSPSSSSVTRGSFYEHRDLPRTYSQRTRSSTSVASDGGTTTASASHSDVKINSLGSMFTFFIFDTRLESRDEDAETDEIMQEILYFFPPDISPSMQTKLLSYCKSIIDINKVFSPEPARRHHVALEKRRVVMRELEPDIWAAMFITVSQLSAPPSSNSHGHGASETPGALNTATDPNVYRSWSGFDEVQNTSLSEDGSSSADSVIWEQHPSAKVIEAKIDDWHAIFTLFYGSLRRVLSHPNSVDIVNSLFSWRKRTRKLLDDADRTFYALQSMNEQEHLNATGSSRAEQLSVDLQESVKQATECCRYVLTLEALSPLIPVKRILAEMYDFLLFYTDISRLTPMDEIDSIPVGRLNLTSLKELESLKVSIKRHFPAVSNISTLFDGYALFQDAAPGLNTLYKFLRLYSAHLYSRRYQPTKRNFLKFGSISRTTRGELDEYISKCRPSHDDTATCMTAFQIAYFFSHSESAKREAVATLLCLSDPSVIRHWSTNDKSNTRKKGAADPLDRIRSLNSLLRCGIWWSDLTATEHLRNSADVFVSSPRASLGLNDQTSHNGFPRTTDTLHASIPSLRERDVASFAPFQSFKKAMFEARKPAAGCPAPLTEGFYRSQKETGFHTFSDQVFSPIGLPPVSEEYLHFIKSAVPGVPQEQIGEARSFKETSLYTSCSAPSGTCQRLYQAGGLENQDNLFAPPLFGNNADSMKPSHRLLWYQHGRFTMVIYVNLRVLADKTNPWTGLEDLCLNLLSNVYYYACKVNKAGHLALADKQRLPRPVFAFRHVISNSPPEASSMGHRMEGFGSTILSGLGPPVSTDAATEGGFAADAFFRQLSPSVLTSWIEAHNLCSCHPVPRHILQYEHEASLEDSPGSDRQPLDLSSLPRHYLEVNRKTGAVISIRDGTEELYIFLGRSGIDYSVGGAEAINIMGGMRGRYKGILTR
eukprot:gb/GECG01006316.1/.p1 GENE.gb/GECG01006316.1/~~gb/GECG01006316.1/.p1  ORF type:complete len:1021 (+),score=95.02 gb/GECG01006316.1/:1-3063(+)